MEWFLFLILVPLWVFFAPFFILGKISNTEERLRHNLEEAIRNSEKRLKIYIEEGIKNALQQTPEILPSPATVSQEPVLPKASPAPAPEAAPVSAALYKMTEEALLSLNKEIRQDELAQAAAEKIEPAKTESVKIEPVKIEPAKIEPAKAAPASADRQKMAEAKDAPGIFDKFFSWLLAEGNIWVCAGVLLLFVGFGLLLRHAIQIGFLTLEMRLAAAALSGIIMTAAGFRLREWRRTYALILQGGGMGVLYMAVLGAANLIPADAALPILPPPFAVFAMLTLSVFTVLLALLQNYQPLAAFAILGGFAAPLLINTDGGDHVVLFSIYTLLNLEILAISFKRDWRFLNRMGFALTAALGVVWGLNNWEPALFNSVAPFLLVFLATYTVISLNAGRGNPDLILAMSTPFAFLFLQMRVIAHFRYGMAVTFLGLGLLHLALGALFRRIYRDGAEGKNENLSSLHLWLCILFSNLAIPHIFENNISSVLWAVQAALFVVIACRSGGYGMLIAGTALHAGAIWLYSQELALLNLSTAYKLSPLFVSGLLFAASHWVSGFWASRFQPAERFDECKYALQKLFGPINLDGSWVRGFLSWTFTVIGSLWWLGTLYDLRFWLLWQIPMLGPLQLTFPVLYLTTLIGSWASVRLNWRAAKFLLVLTLVTASASAVEILFPFPSSNGVSIIAFFAAAYGGVMGGTLSILINAASYIAGVGGSIYLLRKTTPAPLSKSILFASCFAGIVLSAQALRHLGLLLGDAYSLVWGSLFFSLPILALLFCLKYALNRNAKNEIFEGYKNTVAFSTSAFLVFTGWDFFASFSSAGAAVHGVFIPVLNPLEMQQMVFLISLIMWLRIFVFGGLPFKKWSTQAQLAIVALFFLWSNQAAARAAFWYWGAPPYNLWYEFTTPHAQAIAAIVWGVIGLWAILYGKKTGSRPMWRTGTGLLAADLLKLLLVDLHGAPTLTRVLAFLILGGLFLLIGWIAPLPPKEEGA